MIHQMGCLRDMATSLAVDIMYINKIPFIIMTSRATQFGHAKMIKNEKTVIIMKSLHQICIHTRAEVLRLCTT